MSFTFEWDEEKTEKRHGKNTEFMTKASANDILYTEDDDLRPEYDFSEAVRAQHYHPLHEGYTIKIYKADGTTEVQYIMFEP